MRRPAIRAEPREARSRGLPTSSIPELSSTRELPMNATARPGGIHHHHAPPSSALLVCAQYRTVPSDQLSRLVSPAKASATEAPIAYSTVLTKLAAISEISLGMISKVMIRQVFSPDSREAAMKSRFLMVSVCARMTRAPHGQPRAASTMMVESWPCDDR